MLQSHYHSWRPICNSLESGVDWVVDLTDVDWAGGLPEGMDAVDIKK